MLTKVGNWTYQSLVIPHTTYHITSRHAPFYDTHVQYWPYSNPNLYLLPSLLALPCHAMLTKLKTECGSNFTAKLEGMFQDVELSRDAMAAFSQHCSNNSR